MKTLVVYVDGVGLPRAYAVSNDADAAEREASAQLDMYIDRRHEVGETWVSRDDFRKQVRTITPATGDEG